MMGDEDAAGGRGIKASKAAYGSKDYYPTVAELVNSDRRKLEKIISGTNKDGLKCIIREFVVVIALVTPRMRPWCTPLLKPIRKNS